ncbi:hypothetical protein [Pseudaestuariivita rosea]|nr:hypothetical protein [Pseudaestuariivita rosea]
MTDDLDKTPKQKRFPSGWWALPAVIVGLLVWGAAILMIVR